MSYLSAWERLPDAVERVMTANGCTADEAKADICMAIADRAINLRGKLQRNTKGHTSNSVLERNSFQIQGKIKPADFDWEASRPTKSWIVTGEATRSPGYWTLTWIELSRSDVTSILCKATQNERSVQSVASAKGARKKGHPARSRADKAIKKLYPRKVPDQDTVPNALLCRKVGEWLKENRLPELSDDTILRAAGRRI